MSCTFPLPPDHTLGGSCSRGVPAARGAPCWGFRRVVSPVVILERHERPVHPGRPQGQTPPALRGLSATGCQRAHPSLITMHSDNVRLRRTVMIAKGFFLTKEIARISA